MRRSQSKISGKSTGRAHAMPDTAGNRSPLHIPFTFQKRGNTDLLTCVRERIAPAPTSYLLTGLPRNGWLSPRRKIRFGVVSRAQHRFVSAFRPSSWPTLLKERCGIGVYYGISVFGFQRVIVRMESYGREGRALHEASPLPLLSYTFFPSFSSFFSKSGCFFRKKQ